VLPESGLSPEPSLPFVGLHHAATRHPRPSTCVRPQSARPSIPTPCGHQAPSGELVGPTLSNASRSPWLLSKLPTLVSRPCSPSRRRSRNPHRCVPSARRFLWLRLPPESLPHLRCTSP
jgi:hypothetical protein